MIDDLFVSFGLDKAEWLEDIERGESSLASYRVVGYICGVPNFVISWST